MCVCLTGVKRSELKSAHMIVDLYISPFNYVSFSSDSRGEMVMIY